MSAPVEVPADIVERIRTLCLALPEVTVRVDGWAQSFDIDEYTCVRRKILAVLVCYALRWRADCPGRVSAGRGRNGVSVKLDAPAGAADAADM